MDAAAMHEKLNRTSQRTSPSSVDEGSENLDDITDVSESSNKAKEASPVAAATNEGSDEEGTKLREELGEVKNKLIDITQVKQLFIKLFVTLNSQVYFLNFSQLLIIISSNENLKVLFLKEFSVLSQYVICGSQHVTWLSLDSALCSINIAGLLTAKLVLCRSNV